MPPAITQECPDSPDAIALIDELEAVLSPRYPAESRYGYSVEKLIREGVAFFIIRVSDPGRPGSPPSRGSEQTAASLTPAGCGGIQLFGTDYGELKRMYVRPAFRGQGLAKIMVDHLAAYARERGVRLLRLETGMHQHEAIGLYQRLGFTPIPRFGAYRDDPLSRFFEKPI